MTGEESSSIGIGLLGMGVVGSGVARALAERGDELLAKCGRPLSLRGVLVRDPGRARDYEAPAGLLTTSYEDILADPTVDIVVELIGGDEPARGYILRAIDAGKHVVTANKEVIARHGGEVMALASERGVQVLFEASVAGGTPVIAPLARDLVANRVLSIHGIINGTTNYILTRMAGDGVEFDAALREAQELGYAEADPASDVEGTDAAYKLAVLSSLAFGTTVKDSDVFREGISRLRARDFVYAADLGYAIKLLATARRLDGSLDVRVHPVFVPDSVLIAKVDGVLNAVEIETDLAGPVLFHGRGAGSGPTASAVVANIVQIARDIVAGVRRPPTPSLDEDIAVRPMDELETRYYLRLNVADQPGVLAQIATILGEERISIDSVIQKQADPSAQRAELVLMTHVTREASVQKALGRIGELDVVREIGNVVRVEEWGAGASP